MHPARIGLAIVLLAFLALTLWVLAAGGGLEALIALHVANPWAVQISVDLVLALSIVCVFVWRDARTRGTSPWPWIVATLFVGSIAPLAYFLVRPGGDTAPAAKRAIPTP